MRSEKENILLNYPFLCKQNPQHSLHIFGDVSCVTYSGFIRFFPPLSCQHFSYHLFFTHLSFTFLTFKRPPVGSLDKSPDDRALVSSIIKYFLFIFFLFSYLTTYDSFIYIYIYIYIPSYTQLFSEWMYFCVIMFRILIVKFEWNNHWNDM